jgi:hypothetical protein
MPSVASRDERYEALGQSSVPARASTFLAALPRQVNLLMRRATCQNPLSAPRSCAGMPYSLQWPRSALVDQLCWFGQRCMHQPSRFVAQRSPHRRRVRARDVRSPMGIEY